MKRIRKCRGLTVISLVLVVGVLGSTTASVMHLYRARRAEDRLHTIIWNLTEIDLTIRQWADSNRGDRVPTRTDLDGTNGSARYLAWPAGPIEGSYTVSGSEFGGEWQTRHVAPLAAATFDGGSRGAMNRLDWQRRCSSDPTVCGL